MTLEFSHKSIYGYGYKKMRNTKNWIKFETNWIEVREKKWHGTTIEQLF